MLVNTDSDGVDETETYFGAHSYDDIYDEHDNSKGAILGM
jgi:hypothetical protein